LNSKKDEITVNVRENINGYLNWKISNNNIPFQKLSANKIQFDVKIAAKEKRILNYTIEYYE